MGEDKIQLSELFYRHIIRWIEDDAYRLPAGRAWIPSWWLREDTGYSTRQINYHLNKLVKAGKMLKKTSVYYTSYRPVELKGYEYREDEYGEGKFYHIKQEDKTTTV